MNLTPEQLNQLSIHDRARLAMRDAVARVIGEHKRAGLPLVIWRDGKIVWISAEEAEAMLAANPPPSVS